MDTATEKREASAINLSALSGDFGSGQTTVVEDKKDDAQGVVKEEKDPNEQTTPIEENKDGVKEEVKPVVEEKKEGDVKEGAAKEEEKAETPVLDLKDIEGYKPKADEGSWKAVGELFEVDVTEDNEEAFKAAVESKYKAQIEEAKKTTLEQKYAELDPKVATALKLMEMGYSQEQALNPTVRHNELLKLGDAELVRAGLEGLEGWDEDRINLEMESLASKPELLKHEALKAREFIKGDINRINTERDALLQQHTANKEKAVAQQREQHLAQVKEAVMSAEPFLGAKITPEAKSEIFQKYSRGDYGDIFKDGKSVAEFLLFKSFGPKIFEEAKKGFYAQGKEEVTKKLLEVPPKQTGEVAKKVLTEKTGHNQKTEIDALKGDFG